MNTQKKGGESGNLSSPTAERWLPLVGGISFLLGDILCVYLGRFSLEEAIENLWLVLIFAILAILEYIGERRFSAPRKEEKSIILPPPPPSQKK